MKTIAGLMIAAGFAAIASAAWSAELSEQDGSELRQRAQEFQNERSRNPDFQPGQGRLPVKPAASGMRSKRADKSHASATEAPDPLSNKAGRKARSLKNIPGAFVR